MKGETVAMNDDSRVVVNRYTPAERLPEWLTPEEVQAYLDVSRNGVYELLRSGAIPSKRFGRLIRVPRAALRAELNT